MTELVCELIISLDGFAYGKRSPGYYGYNGPDFSDWLKTNPAAPHRSLYGRKTYEIMASLPEQDRDDAWQEMTQHEGFLFSRTLQNADWPGLTLVSEDAVEQVRRLKQQDGSELRTVGSISLVQQLLRAGLVDRLKLAICPLIIPQSGGEPIFANLPDLGFELASHDVLDDRVLLLEYRPVGDPPYRE